MLKFRVSCLYFIQIHQINKNETTKYEGPKGYTQKKKRWEIIYFLPIFITELSLLQWNYWSMLIIFSPATENNILIFNSMQWCWNKRGYDFIIDFFNINFQVFILSNRTNKAGYNNGNFTPKKCTIPMCNEEKQKCYIQSKHS